VVKMKICKDRRFSKAEPKSAQLCAEVQDEIKELKKDKVAGDFLILKGMKKGAEKQLKALEKADRIEIITNKREFVKWNCKLEFHIQDDGKTLKIFVSKKALRGKKK